MPEPPDNPIAFQITAPEGAETIREPNDPILGSEDYYRIRGNVKDYIRRNDLLRKIAQKFETRENNRSNIVILKAMGGRKRYISSMNQQLIDSRSGENASRHRLLPSMPHESPIHGHIFP